MNQGQPGGEPGEGKPPDADSSPICSASKRLAVRLFEEVFNEQRWDALDELLSVDYVEHAVEPFGEQEPGHVHGPSHQRRVVEWLRAQFPDLHMTVRAVAADGDQLVARVRSEGTNLGPLGDLAPPTGRRFVAEQSHWYRVDRGRLCEHWVTRDDLSALRQLGAIRRPDPPGPAKGHRAAPRGA